MSRIATTPPALDERPFRASQAIAAGLVTPRMLRAPAWRRLFYDVYIRASAFDADDHQMWCEAAALVLSDGACFGGWSAAYLWDVPIVHPNAAVWISIPLEHRMRPRNRLHIRRTPLVSGDTTRIRGMPVTTGLRTAFDLGRCLSRTEALVSLDALCHHLIKLHDLEVYATERWSWPDTRQLRELLPMVEPATESPMETRLRLLLVDGRLPRPDVQIEVWSADGHFVARVDLGYRQWKIAIEYEGDHHRERQQYQRDVARTNDLRDNGWLVLRFTADDVFRFPDRLTRQVARAILDRR